MSDTSDVVVVGAGIIGAAIGWRCAQRGLSVTLVDPDPSRGAWHTAAGMLAPVTELHYAEESLFRLGLESLRRYPDVAAELTSITGLPTGFWPCGTLSSAWDAADVAALRDLHAFWRQLGAQAELLSARELRELEPALATGLPGGLYTRTDAQVDPRLLHAALIAAGQVAGVRLVRATAVIRVDGQRAVGVDLDDGRQLSAGTTVLAAGAWSGSTPGVPAEALPPVRPVKGQVLHLRPSRPVLGRVVRASVTGHAVYLVPRQNGDVIVGASLEEVGFDERPRAGAVYDLLRDAQTVLPELGEAELVGMSTGFRPGSPDNAPIIGPSALPGLVHASGHYRNGVLLAPVTADVLADYLTTGTLDDVVAPFRADRFSAAVPA